VEVFGRHYRPETNGVYPQGNHPKELFGSSDRIFEGASGGDKEEGHALEELNPESGPRRQGLAAEAP
jgi:hypothetical protein